MAIIQRAGEVSPEAIGEAIARVLASDEFAHSKRLRRFLCYIVEKSLAGELGDVKEYNIALAVFDREASFDPAADTIVRVEARRLRQQLASYYQGSGRLDPMVIEIPKGAYTPAFHKRESEHPPARRSLPKRWVAAGLAAIALGLVLWRASRLPGMAVPHTWAFDGTTLRVLDANERVCWEKRLGPIDPSSQLVVDKALIADIDGDGRQEVLFNLLPPLSGSAGGSLLCFEQDGKLRWQFRYGAQKTFGTRTFDASYRGRLIRPVEVDGRHLLLTVANHYLWYPSQVALLDPKTARMVDEYWHPGAIYDCVPHGAEEMIFAAINNPGAGLGHLAVGVLKLPFAKAPRRTFAPDDPFRPPTGGGELAYVLFPLQDVNRAMGILPVPVNFKIDKNRITVENLLPEFGGIVYYLDFDLNVLEYRFSDNFAALHQRFFLQHLLDHPLTPRETKSLGTVVKFAAAPDGNSPALRRFWEF